MREEIILEVCVDDVLGLDAAVAGGAGRIELCSSLELGGLSPSPGLILAAAKSPVPVFAMIRPRAGSFVFSAREIDIMFGDIAAAREAGLAGVVLGAQSRNGGLDYKNLQKLLREASGMGTTLHRVVDLLPEPLETVELAIELGFDRILSSGAAKTAVDGLETLVGMTKRAAGRIGIMPGSGINTRNVAAIVAATGTREIHASCSAFATDAGNENMRLAELGFSAPSPRYTDIEKVRELRSAVDRITLAS